MSDEREALLRAVRDEPDDDAPRLVFADWLEEHGDPERAEFVRVQCDLARMPPHSNPGSERRQRELLHRHSNRWLGHWREFRPLWSFHRGFPHVRVLPQQVRPGGPVPLGEVLSVSFERDSPPGGARPLISRFPEWPPILGLDFYLSRGHVARLLNDPRADSLRHLVVRNSGMELLEFEAVLDSPYLSRLRRLDLLGVGLRDEGTSLLAHARCFGSLQRLTLGGLHVSAEAAGALIRSESLPAGVTIWADLVGPLSAEVREAFHTRFGGA